MRKRDILRRIFPHPTSPAAPQKVGPITRLLSRLAAVVYPTNASGNNMSMR